MWNKKAYFRKKKRMSFEAIKIEDVSGRQMISIPENLKINDDKVYLKKVGGVLYVIPFHDPWKCMEEGAKGFTLDFMEDRDQPGPQHREDFN